MSDPIKLRATVKDSTGEVRVLMPHPMESGLRRAPSGQLIPARHITSVVLSLNGRPVIEGALGSAVSANPLLPGGTTPASAATQKPSSRRPEHRCNTSKCKSTAQDSIAPSGLEWPAPEVQTHRRARTP